MAQAATSSATSRFAVVTGANKGIGFDICKQLASNGITVILTARNVKRGNEALQKLKGFGLSNLVLFHQLDVVDPASVASLAEFIKTKFGRLDILVNNAGISGTAVDEDALRASRGQVNWQGLVSETYESAEQCLQANYYGAKRLTEAVIPLLQLSNAPRIVNVSSSMGNLQGIPNQWAKGVLRDVQNLTEKRIDEVLNEFLKDFREGSLQAKRWPSFMSAYVVSKAALSAYTRILAKTYPNFRINAACPGWVKTDLNHNMGTVSTKEAAEGLVKLALLQNGGPTGQFFFRGQLSSFE